MEKITQVRLDKLKAANIPHATPDDLTGNLEFNTDPDVIAYLRHYAKPKVDDAGVVRQGQPCVACDAQHSFTWGLVHGQGFCTGCGWPGTLYHFVNDKEGKEVATMRGALLWAHPTEIEIGTPGVTE